jgi:hypothetical protein
LFWGSGVSQPTSQSVAGQKRRPIDLTRRGGLFANDESEPPPFLPAWPAEGHATDTRLGAREVIFLGDQAIAPARAQLAVGEARELGADAVLQVNPEFRLVHITSRTTMRDQLN